MKALFVVMLCTIWLLNFTQSSAAKTGGGTPVEYVSSCEIDLNGDKVADIAMLIESVRGRELVVLLKTEQGYDAFLLEKDVSEKMFLTSDYGKSISGHLDKGGEAVNRETPGAYLELYQPEGASVAYYWDGHGFDGIWLSD
jgi:hypothetical protein